MKTRTLIAIALTATLLPGMAAEAKPKPKPKPKSCNLISDPQGDAKGTGTGYEGPLEPTLDIIGGDISSNAQRVTLSVKLSAWDDNAMSTSNSSQLGRAFYFEFTANGDRNSLLAKISPAGGDAWPAGASSISVDRGNHIIKFTVPMWSLRSPIKPNAKITDYQVKSARWVLNQNTSLGIVDVATAAKAYNSAWPSCQRVDP